MEQRRRLEQALDRAVPDWRTINNNPHWIAWLCGTHLYSELSRQRHFDAAAARGDADCVISFFRDFLQSRAGRTPPPAREAPTGKQIYSRADIVQAARDFQRGRISEADYQRLSADIVAAAREGRIQDPPMRGMGKVPY